MWFHAVSNSLFSFFPKDLSVIANFLLALVAILICKLGFCLFIVVKLEDHFYSCTFKRIYSLPYKRTVLLLFNVSCLEWYVIYYGIYF